MEPVSSPQPNMQDLTPDEAKASLGLATALMSQMMAQNGQNMPMDGQEMQEMPQGQEENMEPQEQPLEPEKPQEEAESGEDGEDQKIDDLSKDFETFKGEVKGMIEAKMDNLTKTIKDALNE